MVRANNNQLPHAIGLFLIFAVLATIGLRIYILTGGHFSYSLDDPYIHLALARNIFHGHYGLNASEVSSPSSSILWPLILAPFAKFTSIFEYVPLVINIACFIATAFLIFRTFCFLRPFGSLIITFTLLVSLNHFGLVFTGMEHNLHVLLATLVGYGVTIHKNQDEWKQFRIIVYLSLTLLPLVRYEGLAITVPVYLYFYNANERKAILVSAFCVVCGIVGFSLFLMSQGLEPLPASIQLKNFSGYPVLRNLRVNITPYGALFSAIFIYCVLTWRTDRRLATLIFTTTILHICFGQSGWFGRYEVYYFSFIGVIVLSRLIAVDHRRYWFALFMPLVFLELVRATALTPNGAQNIFDQQIRLAEIANRLDGDVAANDIGAIAFKSKKFVFDLYGLSSTAILHARMGGAFGAEHIQKLLTDAEIRYIMIHDFIVPDRPKSWIKVGLLTTHTAFHILPSNEVSFYATSAADAEQFRSVLKQYRNDSQFGGFDITIAEPAP